MSEYYVLVLIISIALVAFLVRNPRVESFHAVRRREHTTIYRHGHRCYMDGLSMEELAIVRTLATNLSHKDYFIFNNIIVPSPYLGTTQIDHIIVSRFGIFVIESKRYNGWIFANTHRQQWTQTLPGGKKYQFHNPLFQNHAHVVALKEHMPFAGDRFFNLVVFSGACEFKTPMPSNVIHATELVDFIKSKHSIKLKEVELLVIIGKLSMLCQTVDVTAAEHAQNVESYIASKGSLTKV